MIHLAILAAAAAVAPPAPTSQPVSVPFVTASAPVPVDPERLALAKTVVDSVWPLGTYEKMVRISMGPRMAIMASSMFDSPDPAVGSAAHGGAASAAQRAATQENQAQFRDGIRNMYRVMMDAMIPIANRIEPEIRDALARSLVRKFDAGQLRDLDRFFGTPTGRAYGHESMFLLMDPEITAQIAKITPELMKAMPQIMAAALAPGSPHPVSNEPAPPHH